VISELLLYIIAVPLVVSLSVIVASTLSYIWHDVWQERKRAKKEVQGHALLGVVMPSETKGDKDNA
jgi:hypothetical protein